MNKNYKNFNNFVFLSSFARNLSEVFIGMFKGVSDLMDSVGQAVGLSDGDYTNPVSQFLEEKQEEFRNWAPVYSDPNKTIANGGLTDFGWWAWTD